MGMMVLNGLKATILSNDDSILSIHISLGQRGLHKVENLHLQVVKNKRKKLLLASGTDWLNITHYFVSISFTLIEAE